MYAAAAASVALARLGLIGAGQVILTSTSWMPAPEGCTTASPLPAADSARSVQEFITQLGRNFQVIYEQANAHGQKVQAAGNNMAQTDSAVGSSWA